MTQEDKGPLYTEFYNEVSKQYNIMPLWWYDTTLHKEHFQIWKTQRLSRYSTICLEQVSSRITKEELSRLTEAANYHKLSKSAFIRKAICFALYNMEKGESYGG